MDIQFAIMIASSVNLCQLFTTTCTFVFYSRLHFHHLYSSQLENSLVKLSSRSVAKCFESKVSSQNYELNSSHEKTLMSLLTSAGLICLFFYEYDPVMLAIAWNCLGFPSTMYIITNINQLCSISPKNKALLVSILNGKL